MCCAMASDQTSGIYSKCAKNLYVGIVGKVYSCVVPTEVGTQGDAISKRELLWDVDCDRAWLIRTSGDLVDK